MRKIKDLSMKELQEYCMNRESCIDCPFKVKSCLLNKYEAEKIRRENIVFLTDEQYESLGNIEIKEIKK